MNLLERLKPEVLVLVNEYVEEYPILGGALVETLQDNEYIINVRYGHIVDLLGLIPYTPHLSPYDLFLDV